MISHIQKEHNGGKPIKYHSILFPSHGGSIPPTSLADSRDNSEVEATEDEISSGPILIGLLFDCQLTD